MPISDALLVYCERPAPIPELPPEDATMSEVERVLKRALNVNAENHQVYSECYGLQMDLVNAVLRRQAVKAGK